MFEPYNAETIVSQPLIQIISIQIVPKSIEYKEGAIGFPYTFLWRLWTAEELVFA